MLVDADRDVLCRLLRRGARDVELIQTACQRHVDEQDEFREARSLLQLIQKDSHDTTADDDNNVESKRKRRK